MQPGSSAYRPDVDGLRAIAVLAVVAFHAFPNSMPGGFVGVDIFFVISGYLITGIILDAIGKGRFTFTDFYIRRIRRIFPALLVVLLVCLVAGWLTMLPTDYVQLSKHVLGGSTFISNLLFYFEAGYFGGDSASKPLLHLWSLGVEEQYYLFWPVLLFLCRGDRRHSMLMIAGIGIASFALNIFLVTRAPEATFYLPVTRFWELMTGSALALMKRDASSRNDALSLPQIYRSLVSLAGALAVAASIALLDATKPFPGWWALLVVAGTAAMIWAGPTAWFNRNVLALRPAVYIGLISYPLYLWHWPLLSFGWHVYGWNVPRTVRVALVLVSFVLAWLTYRFIESPIRIKRPYPQVVKMTQGLAAGVALAGLVGLLGYLNVVQARSASDPALMVIADAIMDGITPQGVVKLRGNGKSTTLFIGDSHMAQYQPRLEQVAAATPAAIADIELHVHGGCLPIPGVERAIRGYCSRVMNEAFERAAAPDVDTVVINAAWIRLETVADFYVIDSGLPPHQFSDAELEAVFASLVPRLAKLRELGKRVVVMTSTPGGDFFDPRLMVDRSRVVPSAHYRANIPRAEATATTRSIDDKLRRAALSAGVTVMNPSDWICTNDLCPAVSAQGKPVWGDAWHLRPHYVRAELDEMDQFLKPATRD